MSHVMGTTNFTVPIQESDGNEWLALSFEQRPPPLDCLWKPPTQEEIANGIRPSSSNWGQWEIRRASCDFRVKYGGGFVSVRGGDLFYVDKHGRVLIGWHGTYSPPLGMDDMPQVDRERWGN
mmetsp:Transcript_680/g.1081  ORF Transcript_680/g.1081 Transcript_680/m.1081 type:complete len:122 (-) Transcript_680:183-548(-)